MPVYRGAATVPNVNSRAFVVRNLKSDQDAGTLRARPESGGTGAGRNVEEPVVEVCMAAHASTKGS